MKHSPSLVAVLALICAALGCASSPDAKNDEAPAAPSEASSVVVDVPSGDLAAALAGPQRRDEERARDEFRKPSETLAFMGTTPQTAVLEVWPGGGWYTAVLAPYLRGSGKLVVANFPKDADGFRGTFGNRLRDRLAATPSAYDQVGDLPFLAPDHLDVGDAVFDQVLLFREVHNMIRWDPKQPDAYFVAMAKALKPGGSLGVVQHRAPEHAADGTSGQQGYVKESVVLRLALSAGLVLEKKSELHANPKDTADHPEGVWTLPPGFRLKDVDREKYAAIGESDRMTMLFRKPSTPDAAVTTMYVGTTSLGSPDATRSFGPPRPAFVIRTLRIDDGIVTETVLDRGKLRTAVLSRREGAIYEGTDDAGTFSGTLDYTGHEAALDGWTYQLTMTDGSGSLTGRGSVEGDAIRTEKTFVGADGTPQARIVEELSAVSPDDFWTQLAAATKTAPAPGG